MGFTLKNTICPSDRHCSKWAQTYIKYCLCGTRDTVSLGLGSLSVLSWGVAEVPQIITNYTNKSTDGLSLAFLITWILGDLFNLFGCLLEPATLPTQYYMALLYTITTLVLTSQSVYYSYVYHRLKGSRQGLHSTVLKLPQSVIENKENCIAGEEVHLRNSWTVESNVPSSPIPVNPPVLPRYGSLGRELYYMSARSLSKSHTPTAGSFLAQATENGSNLRSSVHDPHSVKEPLLGTLVSTQSAPPSNTKSMQSTVPSSIHDPHSVKEPLLGTLVSTQSPPPSNTKSMLCLVSAVTFFLTRIDLHVTNSNRVDRVREHFPGVVVRVGRKLLQDTPVLILGHAGEQSSGIGTFLGWAMAVIYMGGRLPQICLNIKRGNVEGLSPLMFIFALVGNLTYVASILVKSLEWSKIRANLPWIVDAGGCVLLDICILMQFVYFRYWRSRDLKNRHAASPAP